MEKSKFFRVYSKFSESERSEFADYVKFRQRLSSQPLSKFLLIIQRAANAPKADSLDKNRLFKALLPKESFNASKFNNYLSDLFGLLQDYLVQRELSKDPALKAEKLRKAWQGIGMSKLLESGLKDNLGRLGSQATTPDEFLHLHNLQLEADFYYAHEANKKNYSYLERSTASLETYYLGRKLKCYCEMVNRKNVLGVEYDERDLQTFLNYLKASSFGVDASPFIAIYATILNCLLAPQNDKNYELLEELLSANLGQLPAEQAREICYYAQNFCVQKINQGKGAYLQKMFVLFQLMLAERLIFDGAYLSQWNYKNITTVGLRLEAYDWTQNFLEEYAEFLAPNERENAYHFNKAACEYAMGNYDDAMQLLNNVRFNDPAYYLDSKSMLLKIYYELDEFEALNGLCDSFRIYLLRNKKQLAKIHPDLYANLFRYGRRLAKLRNMRGFGGKEEYELAWSKLQLQLSENNKVGNKQWLLSQLEVLKPTTVSV